MYQRAIDLDPKFARAMTGKAFALYRDDPNAHRFYSLFVKASTGHLAEATGVAHTAFRLAPASSVSLAMNAAAHSGVGRDEEALAYIDMADPRKKRAALAALERLESRAGPQAFGSTSSPLIAAWYSQLGGLDRAFDTARRSYLEARQAGIIGMEWQWYWLPELRTFRRDARFDRLMTEVGFKEYWKEYGPPDGCELRDGALLCH